MLRTGFKFPVSVFQSWVSGLGSRVSGFMRMIGCFSVCLILPGIGVAQQPKPIVLKGGKLLTVSHGTIENGVLVMEGGKIAALGTASSVTIPRNARVIDVSGMTVYPGLIDSETSLGLTEISAEPSTNDRIEISDEIMPHMHVFDAFHAESELIPVARINGVTNAIVAPDSGDTLPGTEVKQVFIEGREIPMTSRQTRLRDQYSTQ